MTTEPDSSTMRPRSMPSLFTERPILRAQLAILYSGFFLGLLAIALGAAGLLPPSSTVGNGQRPLAVRPTTAHGSARRGNRPGRRRRRGDGSLVVGGSLPATTALDHRRRAGDLGEQPPPTP